MSTKARIGAALLIASAILTGTSVADESRGPAKLVAWWRMQDVQGNVVPDASRNSHNLTVFGSPIFLDNAVYLNDDGYLQAGDADDLDLLGDFTIRFQLNKADNLTSTWLHKVRALHENEGGWGVSSTDPVQFIIFKETLNNWDFSSSTSPSTGTWHHVRITFSQSTGTVRLYINDDLELEQQGSFVVTANGYPLLIGAQLLADGTTVQPLCRGAIADIRIYDRDIPPAGDGPSCVYYTLFQEEWPLLAADLELEDDQVNTPGDHIPERWGLAMVRTVLCNPNHPHHENAMTAYLANIAALESEEASIAATVDPYKHVLAALLLVNQNKQDRLKTLFGLQNTYEVVRSHSKIITDEIFSDDGDLDDDGITNSEEYYNVITTGGSIEDFAEAVSDPNDTGKQLPAGSLLSLALLMALILLGFYATTRKTGRQRLSRL